MNQQALHPTGCSRRLKPSDESLFPVGTARAIARRLQTVEALIRMRHYAVSTLKPAVLQRQRLSLRTRLSQFTPFLSIKSTPCIDTST